MSVESFEYYKKFGNAVGHRLMLSHLVERVFAIMMRVKNREIVARNVVEALTRQHGMPTVGQWPSHAPAETMDGLYQALVLVDDLQAGGKVFIPPNTRADPIVQAVMQTLDDAGVDWNFEIAITVKSVGPTETANHQ